MSPLFLNTGNNVPIFKLSGIWPFAKLTLINFCRKIRENPTIMKIQNPLQRGFTENSAPLLCEVFIEEYERENKDLNILIIDLIFGFSI
jgi:hypothetical protein